MDVGPAPNGFVDPNVLNQLEDLDLPDSTPDGNSSSSSSTSSGGLVSEGHPRQVWAPTGCCYDDRMKLHANADFTANPHHPEDPRRIEAIMKEFKDAGLIYTGSESELEKVLKESPTKWMWRIPAREATMAEICTVHTAQHYTWVEGLSEKSSAELREMTIEMDRGRKSLYVGNLTFEAAVLSAGGAIETCKNVVAGRCKNAIAVIRPPGHHAEEKEAMGFCIFNNVPIAVRICQAEYPEICRKVLILDWDVHHGNGTQNMFYDDPNVLYISLHVYQNGLFYPGSPDDETMDDGGIFNCGRGDGVGKNVNIGWHDQGMGDGEYMAAFQRIVMPIAQEFDPDFVIISAGFDAAAGDELGGCFVTPACYSHMTHMMMSLANGKVAVCLEGGYNLRAISRSALAVAKTLMGEPPERMTIPPINREAAKVLNQVRQAQAPYWECMRPGVIDVKDLQRRGAERLNDVIRTYQRRILSQKYNMISLYIQRDKLSRSFEDQVLVTPNLPSAKKILLIIHDPPELLATPDPFNNRVEPHNAWVSDGVLPYIDWAVANGYGVLDVNVVMHETGREDDNPFLQRPKEEVLQSQLKDLICYLWDNYFETYSAQSIVLMGVGDSYLGIKQLLINRDSKAKVAGCVAFVSGSLRPVKSETDPSLSTWYKTHSLIYVSPDHACWSDEESARKVRKNRFGRVVMSEEVGLGRMMSRYLVDATSWIAEKVGEREDADETEEEEEKKGI
ncbi:histone deacetylase [Xylogone sp. PMI_703]|nr:histone deacetylase [Xylogone sp. PMI_703]